jgi:hypothetical protein
MDNNFAGLNGLMAVGAAFAIRAVLARRPRWVRWTAMVAGVVIVGGALGVGEAILGDYEKLHDPTSASALFEQEILKLLPAVAVVKQDDPQAWQAFMTEVGRRTAANGGEPTVEDQQWALAQMRGMLSNVWHTAVMADDSAIIALGRKDVAVDEILQSETVQMCATRGDPMWNLNSLPPQSLKAVQEFMALVAATYRQGKGRQMPMATKEQATELVRKAIFWKDSPISKEDADYLFGDDESDAARKCRVRLQFEKNMVAIPESATLLRWAYVHQY